MSQSPHLYCGIHLNAPFKVTLDLDIPVIGIKPIDGGAYPAMNIFVPKRADYAQRLAALLEEIATDFNAKAKEAA